MKRFTKMEFGLLAIIAILFALKISPQVIKPTIKKQPSPIVIKTQPIIDTSFGVIQQRLTTGFHNIAIGVRALNNIDTTPNRINELSTRVSQGIFNVIIGRHAGLYLRNESYCVIVGHDSATINAKGNDMIWIVDWNEPYLITNPDIEKILWEYYNSNILTNTDTKDSRSGMVLRIINRNNIFYGKDAMLKTYKYKTKNK